MNIEIDRNLGEQPIARIMADHGLKARDLVAISTRQLTHKMVSRMCKGRRLTLKGEGYGTFFDELCLIMMGFDGGRRVG